MSLETRVEQQVDHCTVMPLIELMLPDSEEDIDGYHSYFKAIMEPNQTEWEKSCEPF